MPGIVSAILPEVRAALSGIPGGTVRKGTETSPQPVPSWWLNPLGSARLNDIQDLDTCELHIWESSRDRMDSALNNVGFLRRYVAGPGHITVRRQSVVRVQEDVSTHHATLTLEAVIYPEVAIG